MAGVGDVLSTVLSGGLTYGRNEKMTAQATTAEKASKERVVKSNLRRRISVMRGMYGHDSWLLTIFRRGGADSRGRLFNAMTCNLNKSKHASLFFQSLCQCLCGQTLLMDHLRLLTNLRCDCFGRPTHHGASDRTMILFVRFAWKFLSRINISCSPRIHQHGQRSAILLN